MTQAKYTIFVPKVDNLGNPLTDLAAAAHHYLFYGPMKTEGSYIDPDKQGQWRDMESEPHDLLVTYADDEPQMDSQIKQLAAHIGEVANQWRIFCVKEAKGGINTWTISNPHFQQGQPAESIALSQETQPSLTSPLPVPALQ